jgi:hypothetical protein
MALIYPVHMMRDVERRWQQRLRRPIAAADDGSRALSAISGAGGTIMVVTPRRPPCESMPANAIRRNYSVDLLEVRGTSLPKF